MYRASQPKSFKSGSVLSLWCDGTARVCLVLRAQHHATVAGGVVCVLPLAWAVLSSILLVCVSLSKCMSPSTTIFYADLPKQKSTFS